MAMTRSPATGSMDCSKARLKFSIITATTLSNFSPSHRGKFEKGYKTDGLMIFKDQGSYEGGFYSEQFHGKGVLRLKEKTISAFWINGLVEGSCVV